MRIEELGREPIESEVMHRVERLRREEYEYKQEKTKTKYSRTAGYAIDSGAASSSDGPWQGHQYGARADDAAEGDDARESWGSQSWRSSWWSSSTSRPMHDHDRRNFDTPQHRNHEQLVSANTNWEGTRGNWRERVPPQWNQIRARWNTGTRDWANFL